MVNMAQAQCWLLAGVYSFTPFSSYIACPLHKNTVSLETGENLNGSLDAISTYPVKIEDGFVYVGFAD